MNDSQHLDDLRTRHNAGEPLDYLFFWGHKRSPRGVTASCFSQWYDAPFTVDGQRYATAEHFMMAEKAALFGDHASREKVLLAPNPGAAKALGRSVQGFDEAVWQAHRFDIVLRANRAKFTQHPPLHAFLEQTGARVLVEASPVDRVWGIGLAQNDEKARDPNLWHGLNLLGFALMHVRDDKHGSE
jgi:ribA/ribD-fused uncharacterized protein